MGSQVPSSPLIIEPGAWNTPSLVRRLTEARDAALEYFPGTHSFLSHIRVVPGSSVDETFAASFSLEVDLSAAESGAELQPSDIRGVLLVPESTIAALAESAAAEESPTQVGTAERDATARRAALTVFHEILHSLSTLELAEFVLDRGATMRDSIRVAFLEAATHAAAEHFLDPWLRHCDLGGGFAGARRATTLKMTDVDDATGMVSIRVVAYEAGCAFIEEVLDLVADSDELRELWYGDLITERHASAIERLATELIQLGTPPGSGSVGDAVDALRTGITTARDGLPDVQRAARQAVGMFSLDGIGVPIASTVRRVTTPCWLDEAAEAATRSATRRLARSSRQAVEEAVRGHGHDGLG